MKKDKITIHGELCDLINYKALIESQAVTPAFLDNKFKNSNRVKANKNGYAKKLTLNKSKNRGE